MSDELKKVFIVELQGGNIKKSCGKFADIIMDKSLKTEEVLDIINIFIYFNCEEELGEVLKEIEDCSIKQASQYYLSLIKQGKTIAELTEFNSNQFKFSLAKAYFIIEELENAYKIFAELFRLGLIEAQLYMGLIVYDAGNKDKAMEILNSYKDYKKPEANHMLFKILNAENEISEKRYFNRYFEFIKLEYNTRLPSPESILQASEQIAEKDNFTYAELYKELENYKKEKAYFKGIKFIANVVKQDPEWYSAWYLLGNAFDAMRKNRMAYTCYLKSAQVADKEKNWFSLASTICQRRKYNTEACEAYIEAITINRDSKASFQQLISIMDNSLKEMLWIKNNKVVDCEYKRRFYIPDEYVDRLIKILIMINDNEHNYDPYIYHIISKMYSFTKEYDKSVKYFSLVVESYPEWYTGWYLLGNAYEGLKNIKKAYECLYKSAKLAGKDKTWYSFGSGFCDKYELWAEECCAYIEVLKINPLSRSVIFRLYEIMSKNIAYILQSRDKKKERLQCETKNGFSFQERYVLPDESLEDIEIVLENFSEDIKKEFFFYVSRLYRAIGDVYEYKKKYDKALKNYKMELPIYPDGIRKEKVGIFALCRNQWAEGKKIFEEILQVDSDSVISKKCLEIIADLENKKPIDEKVFEFLNWYPIFPSLDDLIKFQNECIENNEIERGIEVFQWLTKIFTGDVAMLTCCSALYEKHGDIESSYQMRQKALMIQAKGNAVINNVTFCLEYDMLERAELLWNSYGNDKDAEYKNIVSNLMELYKKTGAGSRDVFKQLCHNLRNFNEESFAEFMVRNVDSELLKSDEFKLIIYSKYDIQRILYKYCIDNMEKGDSGNILDSILKTDEYLGRILQIFSISVKNGNLNRDILKVVSEGEKYRFKSVISNVLMRKIIDNDEDGIGRIISVVKEYDNILYTNVIRIKDYMENPQINKGRITEKEKLKIRSLCYDIGVVKIIEGQWEDFYSILKKIKIINSGIYEVLSLTGEKIKKGSITAEELKIILKPIIERNFDEYKNLLAWAFEQDKWDIQETAINTLAVLSNNKWVSFTAAARADAITDYDERQRLYDVCIKINPTVYFYCKRAYFYYESGKWQRAMELLEEIMNRFPDYKSIINLRKHVNACKIMLRLQNVEELFCDLSYEEAVMAFHFIARNDKNGYAENIIDYFRRQKDKVMEISLEGVRLQSRNNYYAAYNTYKLMEELDKDTYYKNIGLLLIKIIKKEPDHSLRKQLEEELNGMKFQYEELENNIDDEKQDAEELQESMPEEEENDVTHGIVPSEDSDTGNIDEIVNLIKQSAPVIYEDYKEFEPDDFREPDSQMLTEIEESIKELGIQNKDRAKLYLREARIAEKIGDRFKLVQALSDFGKESAFLLQNLGDYNRQREYAYEAMRIIEIISEKADKSGTNILLNLFLGGSTRFRRPKDIVDSLPQFIWVFERSKPVVTPKVAKAFDYLVKDINLMEKYEKAERNIDKIQYSSVVLSNLQQTERYIKKYISILTFKKYLMWIITNWKNVFSDEGDRLVIIPRLSAEFKNSCRSNKEGSLFMEIKNNGSGMAENVKIRLQLKGCGSIIGDDIRKFENIRGSEVISVVFDYQMTDEGEFEAEITIEYSDIKGQQDIRVIPVVLKAVETEQKFERIINPYQFIAVSMPKDFYGRKKIIETILNNLNGSDYDNVLVIHGLRRVGKTSILNHLMYLYGKEERLIPVFVDLQYYRSYSMVDLICSGICKKIRIALMHKGIKVDMPRIEEFRESPIVAFNDYLDEIQCSLGDKIIVLMFDEFEELINGVNTGDYDAYLLDNLRSMMQHRKELRFILAGADKVIEMLRDYASIIFNMTYPIEVSFMEEDEARDLIEKPLEGTVEYGKASVDKIIACTNSHPFYMKIICHELIERLNSDKRYFVHSSDVDKAVEEIVKNSQYSYFDPMWSIFNTFEKLILSAIAARTKYTEDNMSLMDIYKIVAEYKEVSKKEFIESIDRLLLRNVIRENKISRNGEDTVEYGLTMEFIRLWIKYNKTLEKTALEVDNDGTGKSIL